MTTTNVLAPEREAAGNGRFTVEVTDVTGTHTAIASDIEPEIPAGAVASTIARRMALPSNVPWTLRVDSSATYLDETRPIGDQIADRAKLTITPKTHLG